MILHLDALSAYVQSFALATVLLLVWLVHRQRTGKGFSLWLASAVTGVVLGGIGSYAAMSAAGYKVVKDDKGVSPTSGAAPATPGMASAPADGMGGGGMGGGRGPNPKRELTMLVRKLNLLTDDIALKLSADQSTALVKGLTGVDEAEKFTDDAAKAVQNELLAVLSDEQKAKLEAIGVPGGRGAGGGGGGGMGGGGAPPDPTANPFRQENNMKALKSFRRRFDAAQPVAAESQEK